MDSGHQPTITTTTNIKPQNQPTITHNLQPPPPKTTKIKPTIERENSRPITS